MLGKMSAMTGGSTTANSLPPSPSSCTLSPCLPSGEGKQLDPNAIKMFVGQIPRNWGESECRALFEQFGEIYSLNVLKDKVTGMSKGCCFVTYYSRKAALDAQNALHNIKTLSGMHHPIQMKPADVENRNERKLFVGMLSKKYSEMDVKLMFAPYGIIEDCTILRDSNGQSKGCAFVTFGTRQCAVNAIKMMNHSYTMEGCTYPLVVKFADTQKDKDNRKKQQMLMHQLGAAHANPPITNPYLALAAAAATAQQQQVQHQLAAVTLALQQQLTASIPSGDQLTLAATAALASNQIMLASLCNNNAPTATSTSSLNSTGELYNASSQPFSVNPSTSLLSSTSNNFTGSTGVNNYSQANNFANSNFGSFNVVNKQLEGPEGANLFIYHLPTDFNDSDLASTFSAFGNVLSSKVFIDKFTNMSKCFGFVSYDNPMSALAAIHTMNGFPIGAKRLKVQLKRSKEKPY